MDIGNWWPSSARINPRTPENHYPYERKLTAAEREAAETARYNPTRKPTRKSITATRMPDGGTKVCTTSTKRESDRMTKLFMKMNRSKPGTEIRQNPAMPRRPSNISEAKWNRWIEDWRRIGGRKGAKKVKTFAVAGERRRK